MSAVDASVSDDVLRLVQTVERLDDEDQERILRMVTLLTIAPSTVRDRTHLMLRRLLDSESGTMIECVAAVDEVIAYLETSTEPVGDGLERRPDLLDCPAPSRHN